MSVLKNHRTTSKMEYVNTANEIYVETLQFLTRLSARYSRLVADNVIRLAGEVLDHSEKANSIFPSNDNRRALRERHLLEARASVLALDVHMAHVYELMMLNPQGCFTAANGKALSSADAQERLDKMAQSLGEKIDRENEMITAVLKSDKGRK
jgi:hypothetical protein